MNQADAPDQYFYTFVTDEVAKSDERSNTPQSRSQTCIQLHPPERTSSSDVELRFQQNAALPVHSLPVELLVQIMYHVVRPFLKNNKADYYRRIISLSGVCTHWYSVMQDSPSLWTQVHSSDSPDIVRMALRRSSIHLLDITFIYPTYQDRGPEKMQKFLDIIIAHRNRWRTMDVSVPSSWMPFVTATFREPALTLEKLSLTDQDSIIATQEVELFARMVPQLKDLTLNGVSTPWDSQILHGLNFIDLTCLHFPSTKTILDILSYSPRLQKAVIWQCTTGETPTDPSDSIRLSQLSFLRIDLGRLEAIENVLDRVEVSERGCLAIPVPTGGDVDGFLRRRVAGWTSRWNVAAISKLHGLLLDSDADELRIGILTPDNPKPLTLTVKGFKTLGNQYLLALSYLVDTLAAWSGESMKLHLKLCNPPSTYYATRIRRLFVNELSRLPPITSLEISSVDDYSLVDIVIYEGAWSVFQNICTLSFSGMTPSKLNKRLEWISHATRFVKAATESSLHELDRMPKLQTVELNVSLNAVHEDVEIIGTVAKELKSIVWPGRVVVVYTDQDGLL